MTRSLDIVIVSYNCRELLRSCLALLDGSTEAPLAVHVVDNASADGTVEMVREEFPGIRLTPSATNLGFGAATNIGIRDGSAPYVLALNPDTRVLPGALDRLLDLMDERADVGICGCRLELEDGSLDHAAKRSFPKPLSALRYFAGLGSDYTAPEVESGPVDAVNGAFMLMRRRALDEVGLFDEGYWMYMEDLDLCYRFARAGWVTWYEPTVTVVHVKAGTSGKLRSPRLNYAFHYGMFRFYRRHYAPERNPAVNAAVYAGIGAKLMLSLLSTRVRRLRRHAAG